jgi:hypothetical protein
MTNFNAPELALQNAYAFVIDSINDGHTPTDILDLDEESMQEFAEINDTTVDNIRRAAETARILENRLAD